MYSVVKFEYAYLVLWIEGLGSKFFNTYSYSFMLIYKYMEQCQET